MDNLEKAARVSLLDFRKAYDLINHNKLLEHFMNIGVPSLIIWFAKYLQGRRQMCKFRDQKSECKSIKGEIPQESKLGLLAFIIKNNQLANIMLSKHQMMIRIKFRSNGYCYIYGSHYFILGDIQCHQSCL